jgi:hypothetical protein
MDWLVAWFAIIALLWEEIALQGELLLPSVYGVDEMPGAFVA